jgi:hypothetical protein
MQSTGIPVTGEGRLGGMWIQRAIPEMCMSSLMDGRIPLREDCCARIMMGHRGEKVTLRDRRSSPVIIMAPHGGPLSKVMTLLNGRNYSALKSELWDTCHGKRGWQNG